MELTNEQIEKILSDAPEGADEFFIFIGVANYIDNHENGHQFKIWCEEERKWIFSELVDGWQYIRGRRSIYDLREILKLRKENERLKAQIEAMCNEADEGVEE